MENRMQENTIDTKTPQMTIIVELSCLEDHPALYMTKQYIDGHEKTAFRDLHILGFSSGSLFKSHRVEIQSNILQSKSPSKTSTDTKSATSSANAASSSTLNNIDTPVKVAGTSNLLVPKAKSDEAHNIYTDSSIKNTSHTLSSAPFMNAVTNQPDCTPESPKKPTNTSTSLIISLRQRGNPIIKFIRNVPWEFGDIVPDYQMGKAMCALYLSLRYHHLNPAYIHERLKQLGRMYDLRVLLVQVDVKDPHHSLKELAKISILSDVSLILAFSPEEAGRYLETYKAYENKPPDLIMEKTESNFLAQFTDCVTSTRKVNKTDATTLLTTFGNFEHIAEAGEEDLSLCPGFGPQKAKRLHDVLHEPFLKAKKKKEDSTKSSGGSSTKTSTSATALKSPMKQYLSKEKTS